MLPGLAPQDGSVSGAGPRAPSSARPRAGGSPGALLLEVLVATAAFALVGTLVLGGLSTTHRSGATTESQAVAENVARNQMERVFSLPYQLPPTTYPSVATPSGYSVTAVADEYVAGDPFIQRVVVTVHHGDRTVLALETLRVY